MIREEVDQIVARLHYKGWDFRVEMFDGRLFLKLQVRGTCNVEGFHKEWKSRKWVLSPHMTTSEIVQTAFKAVLTAEEHETREQFLYLGRSIFDPHYNVDELWKLRGEPSALQERSA